MLKIYICVSSLKNIKYLELSTLPWNDRVHDGAGPLYCGGCAYRRESPPLCNTGQPSAGQRIRPEKDNQSKELYSRLHRIHGHIGKNKKEKVSHGSEYSGAQNAVRRVMLKNSFEGKKLFRIQNFYTAVEWCKEKPHPHHLPLALRVVDFLPTQPSMTHNLPHQVLPHNSIGKNVHIPNA